jgi:hypothetical protein
MALAGLHAACGYAGSSTNRWATLSAVGKTVWSETLASPGTTTNTAPASSDVAGDPVFNIRSSIDAFVPLGPTPNASTGPRQFVAANTDYTFYAQPGDKLA